MATGTISSTLTAAYMLSVDPTTILSTGAVLISQRTSAVFGTPGVAWSLINAGQIVNSNIFSTGVNLVTGRLSNTSSGTISALGAVEITSGTVVNAGLITGSGVGVELGGTSALTNQAGGTITSKNGVGVWLEGTGVVTNQAGGLITSVWLTSYGGTLVNAGTIGGGSLPVW